MCLPRKTVDEGDGGTTPSRRDWGEFFLHTLRRRWGLPSACHRSADAGGRSSAPAEGPSLFQAWPQVGGDCERCASFFKQKGSIHGRRVKTFCFHRAHEQAHRAVSDRLGRSLPHICFLRKPNSDAYRCVPDDLFLPWLISAAEKSDSRKPFPLCCPTCKQGPGQETCPLRDRQVDTVRAGQKPSFSRVLSPLFLSLFPRARPHRGRPV